ncbi:MAG: tetratricopeptide repeat protein, partial [Myxococcota bacterium]
LNALAQCHFDAKDLERAEPLLRESVALSPMQKHGWALLGDLLIKQRRYREAAAVLAQALRVDVSSLHTDLAPHPALLWLKRGLAELLVGSTWAARQSFEAAERAGIPEAYRADLDRYRQLARQRSA